jgi:hypothetical protein
MLAALLAFPALALAADGAWPPAKGPVEVRLKVGETYAVCQSGQVICPIGSAPCDDAKVAAPVTTPSGIGWKAIGQGTTLCSAVSASGSGFRRAFRITVVPAEPGSDEQTGK